MGDDWNIDAIEERFFVHGRMEILTLLNELIHRDEPVTIHCQDGGHMTTRLLQARDRTLTFAASADAACNQRLLASAAPVFLAYPDGIRIQFSARQVQAIDWDGHPAFSAVLPQRLARLQRQESFRMVLPVPGTLHVTLLASDGAGLGQWPLHDLSVGGLGIDMAAPPLAAFRENLARVRLTLPQQGEIDCGVTLHHATALANPPAGCACRIGLSFVNLPAQMRVTIQRYIIQAEHQRHSQATLHGAADDV